MSGRHGALHIEDLRIVWAQAHGTSNAFNRGLRLAEPNFHPPAEEPRPCQVRIEHKSPINESGAGVEVADDIGERMPGRTKRERVIFAGRNLYEPRTLAGAGFVYYSIGRKTT